MKIVDIKSPVLRQKAKPVKVIDKKIKKLVNDMKETLSVQEDPEGVGLAAPQVGRSLQIFIMNHGATHMKVVINPKVLLKTKPKKQLKSSPKSVLEGCLSIPYFYGPIPRASKIKIEYTNEEGKRVKEEFTGFSAHIVEHELEHLEGKLFIDHIIKSRLPLYRIEGNEYEEVEL